MPGTRREYWAPKLARNVERDSASQMALESLGWNVYTVWECELERDLKSVSQKLCSFLGSAGKRPG